MRTECLREPHTQGCHSTSRLLSQTPEGACKGMLWVERVDNLPPGTGWEEESNGH